VILARSCANATLAFPYDAAVFGASLKNRCPVQQHQHLP